MNEYQLFYWTGKIIWTTICFGVVCSVIAGCLFAPVYAFVRVKKLMWQWKYAAILASTGFTQQDAEYAAAFAKLPDRIDIESMLAWAREVKERGDGIKNKRNAISKREPKQKDQKDIDL